MSFYNLARMYTETTGTGAPITLTTAVPGCLTFDLAGVSNAEEVQYAIITYDAAHRPVDSEVGTGTYTTSGTSFVRDTVEKSTNGDARINLTGLSEVYICPLASDLNGFTGGGGGGLDSAQYSGSVNTTTVSNNSSGTITITDENWDTATLASVSSDTITIAVTGTYQINAVVFWDIPTAGAPNGFLEVRAITSEGNWKYHDSALTADDLGYNYIYMTWTAAYTSSDTIQITTYNGMGRSIRFNVKEVTLLKIA